MIASSNDVVYRANNLARKNQRPASDSVKRELIQIQKCYPCLREEKWYSRQMAECIGKITSLVSSSVKKIPSPNGGMFRKYHLARTEQRPASRMCKKWYRRQMLLLFLRKKKFLLDGRYLYTAPPQAVPWKYIVVQMTTPWKYIT